MRDPLLTLGCQDPAARVAEAKAKDARRQTIAALFELWWHHHRANPVKVRELHEDVTRLADPQGRGRQYLTAALDRLTSTRLAGFALVRQPGPGRWGAGTFALEDHGGGERSVVANGEGRAPGTTPAASPMGPMDAMVSQSRQDLDDDQAVF